MPDSLAKDAAKCAQKGVFENLQNNPRCGGNAKAYSGNYFITVEQMKADCRKAIESDEFKNKVKAIMQAADEAKQEHETLKGK